MFDNLTQQTFSLPVCLVGSVGLLQKESLRDHLKSIGFANVIEHELDFFDVASARELAGNLTQQSEHDTCLIYIIHKTNLEAQNTLLKSLEDYSGNMALILVIPHEEMFLPTIHSRCHRVDIRSLGQQSELGIDGFDWNDWLAEDPIARMHSLAKKKDDLTIPFLRSGIDMLEKKFHHQFITKRKGVDQLKNIQVVRGWLNSPTPSASMIGEFMALTL